MRRKLLYLLSLAAFAASSLPTPTSAQEQSEKPRHIWFLDSPRCYLAGKKVSLLFSLTKDQGQQEEVAAEEIETSWSLFANGRTLARGNGKPTPIIGTDGSTSGSIMSAVIQLPTLNESVALAAELQILWIEGGQTYRAKRSITLYSDDTSSSRQMLFEQAVIQLFDPVGKTAERLDAHAIPYGVLSNLSAIDSTNKGIVLVGEGVSFRKQRQLAETLLLAAQRGLQVLCLAPSEGDFPLTIDDGKQQSRPRRLVFEQKAFVRHYDKRFDILPDPPLFSLTPHKDKPVISIKNVKNGWSWLSMEFEQAQPEQPAGRLILCGSRIVARWEIGPVPRYLFAHILQELTESSFTEEGQKNDETH